MVKNNVYVVTMKEDWDPDFLAVYSFKLLSPIKIKRYIIAAKSFRNISKSSA